MLVDFAEIKEVIINNLNDGDGVVTAKMFVNGKNKIMKSCLPAGSSIGLHRHTESSEFNYIISGAGKAICDNTEEVLKRGVCHYCPKGSSHSIINTGSEDLVMFTIVSEQ